MIEARPAARGNPLRRPHSPFSATVSAKGEHFLGISKFENENWKNSIYANSRQTSTPPVRWLRLRSGISRRMNASVPAATRLH
jgi:hypothetical protein